MIDIITVALASLALGVGTATAWAAWFLWRMVLELLRESESEREHAMRRHPSGRARGIVSPRDADEDSDS